jgi:hypothetical protein
MNYHYPEVQLLHSLVKIIPVQVLHTIYLMSSTIFLIIFPMPL